MSSGYFLLKRKVGFKYVIKKILNIIKIVFIWNGLYYLGKELHNFNLYSIITIIENIVENSYNSLLQMGTFFHFWFLGALIIVYLLTPIISRLSIKYRRCTIVVLFFICISIQLSSYYKGYPIQSNYIQTFRLWTWLFYYMLGSELENIKEFISNKITKKIHLIFFVIFTIVVVLSQMHIGSHIIKGYGNYLYAEYFYDSLLDVGWIILGFSYVLRLELNNENIRKIIALIVPTVMRIYIIHILIISEILYKYISSMSFIGASLLFLDTVLISFVIVMVLSKIPYLKSIIKL